MKTKPPYQKYFVEFLRATKAKVRALRGNHVFVQWMNTAWESFELCRGYEVRGLGRRLLADEFYIWLQGYQNGRY